MRRTSLHWLLGLQVTALVASFVFLLLETVALALAAGVVYGTAATVTLHLANRFPGHATGDSWTDSRWTGLGVGVVNLAALVVMLGPFQSTTAGYVIGFVVLGVGFVGYVTGSMAELERA